MMPKSLVCDDSTFFPGIMMVLMCWDFIDFNTTRLSAFAGWTTDDAKGEEEEEDNKEW